MTDRFFFDCTVKFMRILRLAPYLWRQFAARHNVSWCFLSQRDLHGFASDQKLKNSGNCIVGRLLPCDLRITNDYVVDFNGLGLSDHFYTSG